MSDLDTIVDMAWPFSYQDWFLDDTLASATSTASCSSGGPAGSQTLPQAGIQHANIVGVDSPIVSFVPNPHTRFGRELAT